MKASYVISALAVSSVVVACSGPASPSRVESVASTPTSLDAAGGGGQAEPTMPFKGTLKGTQSVTPLTPPLAAVNGSASGTATLLGQFTVHFPHTVNFATQAGVGTYTFTAANGDTLTADFTGQASGAPPLVSIVEHATITGGTGRFAGATGSYTVQRQFDQPTGITDGSFTGEITLAAGRQP